VIPAVRAKQLDDLADQLTRHASLLIRSEKTLAVNLGAVGIRQLDQLTPKHILDDAEDFRAIAVKLRALYA
jgi:hypothetical protein